MILVTLAVLAWLTYYQLWHRPQEKESGLFIPDKLLQSHLAEVWIAKFSPNGESLASGSVDSTVQIWDKASGKLMSTLHQPAGITYLDFTPRGDYLVTASYDSKLRLWKIPEAKLVREFTGHSGTVWSLSCSPKGNLIASCGEDSSIRIWDIETGREMRHLRGHDRNVWDVKFSPDGSTLASGSFDHSICIWRVADGKLLQRIADHSQAVVSLSFSPDGQKLASTSDDKTIRLWDTRSWKLIYSIEVPEHAQAVAFSPDGKFLLTGGRDKTMLGEFLQNFFGDAGYNKGVSMRLWDVKTGTLLQTFARHSNDVNDVDFSPDGKWIVSASADKTVRLWKLADQ